MRYTWDQKCNNFNILLYIDIFICCFVKLHPLSCHDNL